MVQKEDNRRTHAEIAAEELLRKGRILIVDDEEPTFLNDLRRARFSVDYVADVDQSNMDMLGPVDSPAVKLECRGSV